MTSERRVSVVTGASRGVGRGIAVALGAAGHVVYTTGRSADRPSGEWPGTLSDTAAEIQRRGGVGIAAVCDHGDDAQVQALFERVQSEQGRLDILVNNAFGMSSEMAAPGAFWERTLDAWHQMIDIGVRSSYVASYYAIPLMIPAQRGLIVNTSSPGSRAYLHTLPYGVGKAAHDKLAHDMAHELRPHRIATLSLWHGIVATERTRMLCEQQPGVLDAFGGLEQAESPEFAGRLIAALYERAELLQLSGGSYYVAELAERFGVRDAGDRQPRSHRALLGAPLYGPVG
jgi:NAD(P)-dependent dehydrogenase (short-subunit alcohol dehydrogenase family)